VQRGLEHFRDSIGIHVMHRAIDTGELAEESTWELNVETGVAYRKVLTPSLKEPNGEFRPDGAGLEREAFLSIIGHMREKVQIIAKGEDSDSTEFPPRPELKIVQDYLLAIEQELLPEGKRLQQNEP
jgi:hypothetical protein